MRRYLYSGPETAPEQSEYDVIIVGSGIAGLYSALHIGKEKKCAVITKVGIEKSNSWLAQGGIAAVMTKEDRSEFHIEDTLKAGAGLCKLEAVKVLVGEGPENIKELVRMDVPFDTDSEGELQITREGGHRLRRIVHCGGDATGRETTKRLGEIVLSEKNIDVLFRHFLVDILTDDSGVCGVVVYNASSGKYQILSTGNLIIATGGLGQIFHYTTNPVGAVGDGIACAMRAGARITNMEMIQFHPTTLISGEKAERLFLISEAVRGEGGILRNRCGEAFLQGKHEMADLAPRDIVTREIFKELRKTGDTNVFLDVSSMDEAFFSRRFPTIYAECRRQGIEVPREPIPVRPAQHFLMGGIETDLNGMTSIDGLYACGEAADTGIHGANRLASNSVLECLVFGRRAAFHINENFRKKGRISFDFLDRKIKNPEIISAEKLLRDRKTMKDTMSRYLGAIRTPDGMKKAYDIVNALYAEYDHVLCDTPEKMEMVNMFELSQQIICQAMARRESVGAHYIEHP